MKLTNLDHFRAQVMTARLYQALLVRQHASKVNGETLLRGTTMQAKHVEALS